MLGITLWYSHFVTSVSVNGKNGKYDCYIKCTTDNVLQILLQVSRWKVKTANTILMMIPWKKVKSYANTPTWSKNSANSQCKAWICKKYHGY
jgi:hypothetical protein